MSVCDESNPAQFNAPLNYAVPQSSQCEHLAVSGWGLIHLRLSAGRDDELPSLLQHCICECPPSRVQHPLSPNPVQGPPELTVVGVPPLAPNLWRFFDLLPAVGECSPQSNQPSSRPIQGPLELTSCVCTLALNLWRFFDCRNRLQGVRAHPSRTSPVQCPLEFCRSAEFATRALCGFRAGACSSTAQRMW